MRQFKTKERAILRREFVYMYRQEIEELETASRKKVEDWINEYPRKQLEYKDSTFWLDIWLTLRRDKLKLLMH